MTPAIITETMVFIVPPSYEAAIAPPHRHHVHWRSVINAFPEQIVLSAGKNGPTGPDGGVSEKLRPLGVLPNVARGQSPLGKGGDFRSTVLFLSRLRNDIHQCGLAPFHSGGGTPESRAEILRIRNGTFRVQTHALGDLGKIDVGIREG